MCTGNGPHKISKIAYVRSSDPLVKVTKTMPPFGGIRRAGVLNMVRQWHATSDRRERKSSSLQSRSTTNLGTILMMPFINPFLKIWHGESGLETRKSKLSPVLPMPQQPTSIPKIYGKLLLILRCSHFLMS